MTGRPLGTPHPDAVPPPFDWMFPSGVRLCTFSGIGWGPVIHWPAVLAYPSGKSLLKEACADRFADVGIIARDIKLGMEWSSRVYALSAFNGVREAILQCSNSNDVEAAISALELRPVTKRAKARLVYERRLEFGRTRADLKLAMIARGDPYRCAMPECDRSDDLTVDHVLPLSQGGTDSLENLQFLCRSCNSAKGDRAAALAITS